MKRDSQRCFLHFALLVALLMPGFCHANLEIFSPVIDADSWEVETSISHTWDSDREHDELYDQVIEVEHAITPRWLAALGAGFLNGPDMNLEHASSRFENVFWLTPGTRYAFDAGLYFEYIHRHGRERIDTVEFKLLLERYWNKYYGLINLTLEKEIGAGREPGSEPEYALRLQHRLNEHVRIGVEAYGEVDERKHIIGPMLHYEFELLDREMEMGVGWLKALTDDAAEDTLLFTLSIDFTSQ